MKNILGEELQHQGVNAPLVHFLQDFHRPPEKIDSNFFFSKEGDHVFQIDEDLKASIKNLFGSEGFEITDERRNYHHFYSGNVVINDVQIIQHFNITKLISLKEMLVTVGYLVKQDLKECGSLYELSLKGQCNLNLGYSYVRFKPKLDDKLQSFWMERIMPTAGTKREYHLHHRDTPRDYKPNRHMLV